MTRSSTNKLFTPFKDPKREFRSSRRHFKTLSLDKLRSPDFNLFSNQEYSEEEVAETMAKTIEKYMSKTRADYGSGVARPKNEDKDNFELKGQFLKELRTNTFSGSDHEDANEHIEKVLEIVDIFHIPNITIDQVTLRALPMSLTGAVSRWLRNEPTGSITTWDGLKTKFLNKYCPPARTAKKMEEINNFQQEPDENLYQVWERFKELSMKCPQHYLTKMQEVILFYNGLGIPTRQILDLRGAIPSKNAAESIVAIQEMAEYSQKWHNGTSRTMKYPKGIVENVLVGIGKFVFPIDFIILDMTEDIKVPLILRRPFLSTTRAKIDVYKRKITLRVREERIVFTSIKPASNLIKRVYMLSFRERMDLDLEAMIIGETLVLNRSLDPFFKDYIELIDINEPIELRRNQGNELIPTIEEKEVIEEFRTRDDKLILEDMDAYRDEGMGNVIFSEPFLREVRINVKRFDGMITIYNGPRKRNIDEYWWKIYKSRDREAVES
ncbi:gag-pol polyprotein [Tanacetum coccineum]